MDSDKVISVTNLTKSYGDSKAVDNISFSVKKGELFALLGPNGAGKSTTISVLCTMLSPDMGKVFVNGYEIGKDNHSVRESIGIVFQESMQDVLLTVRENIEVNGRLHGMVGKELDNAISTVTEATGISEILDRRYGTLSGGQKRRSDLARILIHSPKVLFLDEPTTGLDPQARKDIWILIDALRKEHNITVLLTTHYMEEAAGADNVVVINRGTITAEGTPDELKEKYTTNRIKLIPNDMTELSNVLSLDNISFKTSNDALIIDIPETLVAIDISVKYRDMIKGYEVLMGTMDDAFLSIAEGVL